MIGKQQRRSPEVCQYTHRVEYRVLIVYRNVRKSIHSWAGCQDSLVPLGPLNMLALVSPSISAFHLQLLKFFILFFYKQDIAGGVKPEEFDAFHELILHDELGRLASGGAIGALFGGLSIGLPPVQHFGSKYLQDKVSSYRDELR